MSRRAQEEASRRKRRVRRVLQEMRRTVEGKRILVFFFHVAYRQNFDLKERESKRFQGLRTATAKYEKHRLGTCQKEIF